MLEKLQEMIAEQLGLEKEEVLPGKSLKDDLGADSLDLFEMVTNLEDEYGLEIPSEKLETLVTVQDVLDYLEAQGVEA